MMGGCVACVGSYDQCAQQSRGKLSLAVENEECGIEDIHISVHDFPSREETSETSTKLQANPVQEATESNDNSTAKLAQDENKESSQSGIVKRDTFVRYLKSMPFGMLACMFLLTLSIVTQASVLVTIAAVGKWSSLPAEKQSGSVYIPIVAGLVVLVCCLAVVRARLLGYFTIEVSKRIHDQMTSSVLRASVSFFDLNNKGRIQNRFSGDVGSNDDLLPSTLGECLVFSFIVLGALFSTVILLPATLIVCPPLVYCFLKVRETFVNASRELKRIEGMCRKEGTLYHLTNEHLTSTLLSLGLARSPIITMLSESMSGISTIRSNDAMDYFRHKFRLIHDAHGRAFFSFLACSRWLGFWIDSLMVIFLTMAAFVSVVIVNEKWIEDSSILGVAFTLLIQSAYMFQWTVRQSAEAVNQMVAVERTLEYCDLQSEAPLESEFDGTPGWPSLGNIDIQSLSVRYRPGLPLSLKNATLQIEGGSRVGVVGRTGKLQNICIFTENAELILEISQRIRQIYACEFISSHARSG